MKFFTKRFIRNYIVSRGYKNICEIGAAFGHNMDKLLEINALNFTVIDPCIDADLTEKYKNNRRVAILKGLSLEVLPTIKNQFDCILIDGDHNWYTVYNELKLIETRGLIKGGGTIFLHDVGWPYGRRDLYYIPESIPPAFRHPYEKKGIGRAAKNSGLYNAVFEGGPKNGVRTAIEDFLSDHAANYFSVFDEREHGLGVLVRRRDFATAAFFGKFFLKTKFVNLCVKLKNPI